MTSRRRGGLGRRAFLSALGAAPLGAGFASRTLGARALAARFEPQPGASDAAVFADARGHFLVPDGVAYCNTGTLGASPREVVEAQVKGIARIESELADWPYERAEGEPLTGYQPLPELRAAVGRLVSGSADEIALVQNATMAMNFLGHGLDLAAGDEVVTTDQEHSGGISVFRLLAKRRGLVLHERPLEPALAGGPEAVVRLFADAITPKTRAIMFSHITSGLGIRLPARELCALARDRGVLSLVDGAQAVGQVQVDVRELGCDAYAGSPHKWLMAPKGTGFLYIRRGAQDRFWTTLAGGAWDDREKGAFRFMQFGTGSVPAAEGLAAALAFVGRLGMGRIERWDAALTARLRDGLARNRRVRLSSPADPRFAAAITTFRVDGVPAKRLQDALWARRIRVRAQNDARGVRLSAHLYVAPDDIDRVLDVVAAVQP